MKGVLELSADVAGMGISGSLISREYDGGEGYGPWVLAAAKTGEVKTKTDADTAVITFEAEHGFEVGDKLDIYWAAGLRYYTDVTNVDGNDVTCDTHGDPALDGGDDFPVAETAVTGFERLVKVIDFDGDDVVLLTAWAKKRGHIHFLDTGGANIHPQELQANELWPWVKTWGYANPITGNAATALHISNGEAVASEIRVGVLKGTAL